MPTCVYRPPSPFSLSFLFSLPPLPSSIIGSTYAPLALTPSPPFPSRSPSALRRSSLHYISPSLFHTSLPFIHFHPSLRPPFALSPPCLLSPPSYSTLPPPFPRPYPLFIFVWSAQHVEKVSLIFNKHVINSSITIEIQTNKKKLLTNSSST